LIVLPAIQEAQANHKAVNDSRSKGQRGEFAPAIVSVKVKIAQPADRLRLLNNNNPTFSFYFSSSTKIKH
jgi:hypothetical protein